jgi:hypothetical protein
VAPSADTALVTLFSVVTAEWGDDVDDYPFSFEYKYYTSTPLPAMPIQGKTTSNVVISKLPSGLDALDFEVTLITYIYDNLGAAATEENG